MTRIERRFTELKERGRAGLVTFITAGDPDYATSLKLLESLPKAGADIVELGMPFSDPMADGPAIQASSARALHAGQTMVKTLAMVKSFREKDEITPIVLMGYYNPIYIYGVEAAGHGLGSGKHAASIAGGRPGVLHGNRTYLLMDGDGQIEEAHSISAGLDYPGIGPEHAWLNDMARVKFLSATDDEAVAAFQLCSKLEGIIPALEPAHALARVLDLAPKKPKDHLMVVNLSGRGDKDLDSVASYLSTKKRGAT